MVRVRSFCGFPILLLPAFLSLACGGGDSGPAGPEAPSIAIVAPADGAVVSGAVTLRASASRCDVVRFLVDGVTLAEDSSAPYETVWNSGSVANGAHVLKVVGEGPGGTAEDEVGVTVQNTAGEVIVTVSPAEATVALGQSVQFAAVVTGSADTGVTWTVEGGSSRGAVTAGGLYTAPATLPSPPTATVRATSRADGTKSGTATVTLIPGGGGVMQQEKTLARNLFNLGREASSLGTDLVSLGAQAAFGASELAGTPTLTGTLTQSAPNSETWTWSSQPADRLVVVFAGGPTFEFRFTVADGYTEGGWEDFVDRHELDFTARVAGQIDVRVVSSSGFVGGAEVPYTWKLQWNRRTTGSVSYEGTAYQVDVTHAATQQGYNEPGFAGLENDERTTGQASAADAAYSLDSTWWSVYTQNSNVGEVVRNWQMTVDSDATVAGETWGYQGAGVRWEASSLLNDPGAFNVVRQPDYWVVQGSWVKNGVPRGVVEFSGPVVRDTQGPDLVLRFTGGETVTLHTLVPGPGE